MASVDSLPEAWFVPANLTNEQRYDFLRKAVVPGGVLHRTLDAINHTELAPVSIGTYNASVSNFATTQDNIATLLMSLKKAGSKYDHALNRLIDMNIVPMMARIQEALDRMKKRV